MLVSTERKISFLLLPAQLFNIYLGKGFGPKYLETLCLLQLEEAPNVMQKWQLTMTLVFFSN